MASKLEKLGREFGGNVDESMGANRPKGAATPTPAPAKPGRMRGVERSKNVAEIPIEKIDRDPGQPREDFDQAELDRLADSLKAHGQISPIRVRWDEARDRWVVVVGERRWRAARQAGIAVMTCVMEQRELEPGELLALQVIENSIRSDLKPIEEARAYRVLMSRFGWSGNKLAQEIGVNQSSISRSLALLSLPEEVQAMVESGGLNPSTACEVSKVEGAEAQREVAERIASGGLSRTDAIEEVRKATRERTPSKGPAKGRGAKSPKLRTDRVFNEAPFRFAVTNRKGIDPAALHGAILRLADRVKSEIGEMEPAGA